MPNALPAHASSEHATIAARAAALSHDQLAANHAAATINLAQCREELADCKQWMRDHHAELIGPVGMGFVAALTGAAISVAYAKLPHGVALGGSIATAVTTGITAMMLKKHPEVRSTLLGSFCGSVGAISALEGASYLSQRS
jgi:hypothetical protein